MLKEYDVVTWRDASYYKTLLLELASEDGGILLAKRSGRIEGVFCYAKGEKIVVREPLFRYKEDLQYAIYEITGNESEEVLCIGYGGETKPMIMAKILNSELSVDLKKVKVFLRRILRFWRQNGVFAPKNKSPRRGRPVAKRICRLYNTDKGKSERGKADTERKGERAMFEPDYRNILACARRCPRA